MGAPVRGHMAEHPAGDMGRMLKGLQHRKVQKMRQFWPFLGVL